MVLLLKLGLGHVFLTQLSNFEHGFLPSLSTSKENKKPKRIVDRNNS